VSETSDLVVKTVSPDASAWRAFVEDHPAATVFHTAEWARAVEVAFGYEPQYVLVVDHSGEIRAAIPGFVVSDGIGSSVLNPFCEYGFPLIDDETTNAAVLSVLKNAPTRIVKDAGWSGVSGYNAAGYGGISTGSAIRLSIERPYEELWESTFAKDVRRCVRTARDHGVRVTDGRISEFYPLYLETMRRLGSPQFPERFFTTLAEALGDSVAVLLAEREGDPIGGVFLFEWGDTTMVWTPASNQAHWEHRPNHLLYAEAIERACIAGRSVVDFGRSRRGSSVHGFKAQFGGFDYPLMSFVTPPHHTKKASLDGYGRLSAITPRFAPLITHPTVGPKLKGYIHE
jgi:CelD/BcsL family acetyltransferase involved in cellulose biosynthesis